MTTGQQPGETPPDTLPPTSQTKGGNPGEPGATQPSGGVAISFILETLRHQWPKSGHKQGGDPTPQGQRQQRGKSRSPSAVADSCLAATNLELDSQPNLDNGSIVVRRGADYMNGGLDPRHNFPLSPIQGDG